MAAGTAGGRRKWLLVVALGLGLVAAPAIFQMFGRAPAGGRMLDDFEPYMSAPVLEGFTADLDLIDRAVDEARGLEIPAGVDAQLYRDLDTKWEAIHSEMGDMLSVIQANLGNYGAVRALPPFALFPWFFVLPGLGLAALGIAGLRRPGTRSLVPSVAVLGIAVALAPVAFQMFDRAPKGADMIDQLRPWMTVEDVRTMQSHFLVIGGGEGNLRNDVLPAAGDGDGGQLDVFFEQWPRISAEMAPMIGAMSDNVDAFRGIDALPDFALFPWFFVVPGLAAAGAALAGTARRGARTSDLSHNTGATHT